MRLLLFERRAVNLTYQPLLSRFTVVGSGPAGCGAFSMVRRRLGFGAASKAGL